MKTFEDITFLLKLAKKTDDGDGVKQRVALLADTASQLLSGALKGYVRHLGQRPQYYTVTEILSGVAASILWGSLSGLRFIIFFGRKDKKSPGQ